METSDVKESLPSRHMALAESSPAASDLSRQGSITAQGDTLGMEVLALRRTPNFERNKSRRAIKCEERRASAGVTWPPSQSGLCEHLKQQNRKRGDRPIALASAEIQAAEARNSDSQGYTHRAKATSTATPPAAAVSPIVNAGTAHSTSTYGAQSPSSRAFDGSAQSPGFSLNGAGPVYLSSFSHNPGQGFVSQQRVTASVPLFRNVPPWRIDKWYRYPAVPTYQALPIAPVGQRSRPLSRGTPTTAITLDRLSSPKRGLPSISQPTRGLPTGSSPKAKRYDLRSLNPPVTQPQSGNRSPSPRLKKRQSPSPPKQEKPLPAPTPSSHYLSLASILPKPLPEPQRLLLVLDLNGTLLYRSKASSKYRPRASLEPFLDYCLTNHSVLIWSSATPSNVTGVCDRLFNSSQRQQLLGEWGRDTLDLTNNEYYSKCQVYKRLDRIWEGRALRGSHPDHASGGRWSQANTLLLDDSAVKAQAQPYNLVETPEFTRNAEQENGKDILGQVVAYLEEARMWGDVSAFVKRKRFVVDADWKWNWETPRRVEEDEDKGDGEVRLWG